MLDSQVTLSVEIVKAIITGADVSEVLMDNISKAPQQVQDMLRKHFVRSELLDLDYDAGFYRFLLVFAGFPPPPAFRIRLEETLLGYFIGSRTINWDLLHPYALASSIVKALATRLTLSFISYVGTFYYPMAPLFNNVGISDEKLTDSLSIHSGRSSRWLSLVFLVYFLLIALVVVIIWSIVKSFFRGVTPAQLVFWDHITIRIGAIILMLLSIFLVITVPFRFAFRVINGWFAETICVRESLQLLLDLDKEDLLSNPTRRRILQSRIDYLAKANALVASRRYSSSNKKTQERIEEHFRAIEEFIREREWWVVAPMESTSDKLKENFSDLARIYIYGDYGRFVWEKDSYARKTETTSWWKRAGKGLLRLLGFALPLVLMSLYLWNPSLFPFIEVDLSVPVTYLFVGWLLITIDIAFNLGVVSELTKTAKGIKDLGA